MKTRPRKPRKPGPNTIRAWFDTVFRYLLGRLFTERSYLSRGDWSYRFYKRSLDCIVPIAENMPAAAQENLEQFAQFYPSVTGLIAAHDRTTSELTLACNTLHEAIIGNEVFRQAFAEVESGSVAELGGEFREHFGALSERADFAGLIAEYLVNNVGNLPGHYSTSVLWNRYRERFAPVISQPNVKLRRDAAEQSGRDVLEAGDRLRDMLKSTRAELALENDVPYAMETASAPQWPADV